MKKTWKKKGSAFLLVVMLMSSLLGMEGTLTKVHAAENTAPTSGYWTDAEGLKEFNVTTSETTARIRFGLKGEASREWLICGVDGSDLALLSTTYFGVGAYGTTTNKYSESNFVKDINKYSDGDPETSSIFLGTDFFSSSELDKINAVEVRTNNLDPVTGKLYFANTIEPYDSEVKMIYVGKNNDIPIDLMKLTSDNGFQLTAAYAFWLRQPYPSTPEYTPGVRTAVPLNGFSSAIITNNQDFWLVPALNLNMSSVLFASVAEAASSEGYIPNSGMTANTYTLRYESNGEENAAISANRTQVKVTGANGKYLMIQNSAGVYALNIDSDDKVVKASDITMDSALTDFYNCKVWIESTNADRITTAKAASIMPPYNITEGKDSAYTKNSDGTLTIKGDGALADFLSVKVDGNVISSDNYTATSGSTIITLKKSYLDTLSVDKHTIEIVWTNGSASTTFTVNKESPKTGDNLPVMPLMALLLVSGLGFVALVINRRRREHMN